MSHDMSPPARTISRSVTGLVTGPVGVLRPSAPGRARGAAVTVGLLFGGEKRCVEGGSPVVRLTCLLRRKPGLTPEEFHEHWRNVHGPLIGTFNVGATCSATTHNTRDRCRTTAGVDDGGYDGVTVQWFENMDAYNADTTDPDFPVMWKDVESFLDTDRLHFIVTEDPLLVIGEPDPFPLA